MLLPDAVMDIRLGTPDMAWHPVSGVRPLPDDMLNLVSAVRDAGSEPKAGLDGVVEAFLADGRARGLSPRTLEMRQTGGGSGPRPDQVIG